MALIALFMINWGIKLVAATWQNSIADFPSLSVGVTYLPIPIGGAILLLFVFERLAIGPRGVGVGEKVVGRWRRGWRHLRADGAVDCDLKGDPHLRRVPVRPRSHWHHVFGKPLQFCEWRAFPIARAQQNRDHRGFPCVMTFKSSTHFIIPTII